MSNTDETSDGRFANSCVMQGDLPSSAATLHPMQVAFDADQVRGRSGGGDLNPLNPKRSHGKRTAHEILVRMPAADSKPPGSERIQDMSAEAAPGSFSPGETFPGRGRSVGRETSPPRHKHTKRAVDVLDVARSPGPGKEARARMQRWAEEALQTPEFYAKPVPALSLDLVFTKTGDQLVAGRSTDRPTARKLAREIYQKKVALTERAKRQSKQPTVRAGVAFEQAPPLAVGKNMPAGEHQLPPWFRASSKKPTASGFLSSEQVLRRVTNRGAGVGAWRNEQGDSDALAWKAWEARQESVLRGGQEPDNLAVFTAKFRDRLFQQHQSSLLPKLTGKRGVAMAKPTKGREEGREGSSGHRVKTSELFKEHDPVDGWTFGLDAKSTKGGFGRQHRAGNCQSGRGGLGQKHRNVDLLENIQRLDPLGLPLASQQICGHTQPVPGTQLPPTRQVEASAPRPAENRPSTMSRIQRRVEKERKENLSLQAPEPTRHGEDVVETRALMNQLVAVSRTGQQDTIEAFVTEVLDACAKLCKDHQYHQAEKLYRAVLEYCPDNAPALCNLGIIIERVHDNPAAAADLYEQALEALGGQDIECLIHLARCTYRKASDISKPRALLQKVLTMDPAHYGALNNMALLLLSEWMRSRPHIESLSKSDSRAISGEVLLLQGGDLTLKRSDSFPDLPGQMGGRENAAMSAAEVVEAATAAVSLSESFFWKAFESAKDRDDQVSMALALGNLATIQKMCYANPRQAEILYKRAIGCDPRHPILRRNYARLYHDYFEEKIETATAVMHGRVKAAAEVLQGGKWTTASTASISTSVPTSRSAAVLGKIAETEYRKALSLCEAADVPSEVRSTALKLDLCLNLASLLCEDAMGQRWADAKEIYNLAHHCDASNLQAAMALSAILWERENRLHEAEAVLRKSLGAHMQHGENQRRWKKVRSAASTISKFLATKADHIEVKKKRFGASLLHASNYMNLAHFEASKWELKASSTFMNLEKFGATSVFDLDENKEWATATPFQRAKTELELQEEDHKFSHEVIQGEWVYVKYSEPYIVALVKVKQRKVLAQMVRLLAVYFDGGENRQMLLLPEVHEQELVVDPPVLTSLVRFEILQTYGEAHSGLNTVEVLGQHRGAADLTLKYDSAAAQLQALKEQTMGVDASKLKLENDQIMIESKVMHAKLLLAGSTDTARSDGARLMDEYFKQKDAQAVLYPALFSSALGSYGAYVQTLRASVVPHHKWMPLNTTQSPREQGESLFALALDVHPGNVDAQLRLAISFNDRLSELTRGEEYDKWTGRAEQHYQTTVVQDPTNVMALYCYALFLQEHMDDLNQAIKLLRRASKAFCANKDLQASVLCSLATALQRRGRSEVNAQVNIFSVREEEDRLPARALSSNSQTHSQLSSINDLEEAAAWYERSLAVNGRNVACLCNYGTLQLHRNYPSSALRHFARAIHAEPYNVRALSAYAAALDDVGAGLRVVERMYTRAVILDPQNVLALNGLGTVAHRKQDLGEAENLYKRALLIEPTNADVTENLSILREATFAQSVDQGGMTAIDRSSLRSRERALLSSREGGRLPSRSGLASRERLPSRSGLASRERLSSSRGSGRADQTYITDRPSSRDLSNAAFGSGYTVSTGGRERMGSAFQNRLRTPSHSMGLVEQMGIKISRPGTKDFSQD